MVVEGIGGGFDAGFGGATTAGSLVVVERGEVGVGFDVGTTGAEGGASFFAHGGVGFVGVSSLLFTEEEGTAGGLPKVGLVVGAAGEGSSFSFLFTAEGTGGAFPNTLVGGAVEGVVSSLFTGLFTVEGTGGAVPLGVTLGLLFSTGGGEVELLDGTGGAVALGAADGLVCGTAGAALVEVVVELLVGTGGAVAFLAHGGVGFSPVVSDFTVDEDGADGGELADPPSNFFCCLFCNSARNGFMFHDSNRKPIPATKTFFYKKQTERFKLSTFYKTLVGSHVQ